MWKIAAGVFVGGLALIILFFVAYGCYESFVRWRINRRISGKNGRFPC